jgi:hypothetical protein
MEHSVEVCMSLDPTMIDWDSLILRGCESKDLDYKGPCAWDNSIKKACCELVKDVLALANAGGGWLVIGVNETGTAFSPDGVSDDQAASFETTQINTFLNKYADPPINTRIHKPEVQGKRFIAVEVPGFPDTPHNCQKEYPNVLTAPTLYVRSNNNESAPIKSSADFRAIVERATRNRADSILASVREVLTHGVHQESPSDREQFEAQVVEARKRCDDQNPHKDKGYGYRESVFYPSSFSTDRFDLPSLKAMALNASVEFRGWPFLEIRRDLLSVLQDGYESMLNGSDELHFWQLRQSGMLYIRQLLREDTSITAHSDGPFLHIGSFSIIAFEAVHCLVKLYEGNLDDSEQVSLQFRFTGTQGRSLRAAQSIYLRNDYVCHIPSVSFEKTLPIADWRSAQMEHGLAIYKDVCNRFNWEEPNLWEARKLMEKAVNRTL